MSTKPIANLWKRVQQSIYSKNTFRFRGFSINNDLAVRTGAPKEHYAQFAQLHEELQSSLAPVEKNHVVLEAGCGTGMDAILLTSCLSSKGRYTGFDIASDNIAWCTANITRRFPNFRFIHFDIHNSTYNPDGSISATDIKFPEQDGVVDRFIAQSVFTHLLPDVASHYLHELRRVLHPEGLALITCFLGTQSEIEYSVESQVSFFRFPHQYAPGVYINDPEHPSNSVVYEHNVFTHMLQNANLALTKLVPGNWAKGRATHNFGQDIIILSSSDPN